MHALIKKWNYNRLFITLRIFIIKLFFKIKNPDRNIVKKTNAMFVSRKMRFSITDEKTEEETGKERKLISTYRNGRRVKVTKHFY